MLIPALLKNGFISLFNKILPFYCPGCSIPLLHRGVCPCCWKELTFLTTSCCYTCNRPFPFHIKEGLSCAKCLAHPPAFQRALCVFTYGNLSKKLILKFKYSKDLSLVPLLATWLHQRGASLFQPDSLLIPVPLHWTRLWARRFNQSAILAQCLSKKTQLTYIPNLLKRVKRTPSQGHLTFKQRHDNMKGAFKLHPQKSHLLEEKHIILVDDVYTSGATLNACSKVLLEGGAEGVSVLALARVL